METYNCNSSGIVSAMENSASQNETEAAPAAPGFGPAGPSMPENGNDVPAAPGFGPVGPVTPSVPSQPSVPSRPTAPSRPITPSRPIATPGNCINCGAITWPGNTTGILWTWGTLAPFFSTSSEVAHLRFYNASAIQEPMDIYLNGRLVVSELDYMNYTRFLHIIPGLYRLTIYRTTNPGMPIIDSNIRLNSGTSYTLTILGTMDNFSVQMMSS